MTEWVWISRGQTGHKTGKYHKPGCSHLKNAMEIDLVKKDLHPNRRPCKTCHGRADRPDGEPYRLDQLLEQMDPDEIPP